MFIAVLPALALLGCCGLMAAALIALRRRRKMLHAQADLPAHACRPGSFKAVAVFQHLCDDSRGGHLVVWNGLYCETCYTRLVCAACGKSPLMGAVLAVPKLFDGTAYHCCPKPEYVPADPETPEEWKLLN